MENFRFVKCFAIRFLIVPVVFGGSGGGGAEAAEDGGGSAALDEEKKHRIDSLNILVFVCLLILTVLTIWMFKHRRIRFLHETGLAILYGLIVGAIIRYTVVTPSMTSETVELNGTIPPPDFLNLHLLSSTDNASETFQYRLEARFEELEPELEEKATFNPEVFFNVILPPIVFNAGYHMKRKHFFKNFGAIVTYAFVGTTISCFLTGCLMFAFCLLMQSSLKFIDCLLFGAIISATDTVSVLAIFHDLNVDVDLYTLVFGESVLNDAVAIILVSSIQSYKVTAGFDFLAFLQCVGHFFAVFFGAFALGAGMGCVTAVLTKYTKIQDFPLLETSLVVLMSYGTFLAAEALGLTGIVAVLFCGICQAHYTYNNLSPESKARTKEVFELLNFLMENFVFTYIGVSTFTFQKHVWDPGFIILSFVAILIGRAMNIYPLSLLLNLGRSNKISFSFQHMMMFSGLRGAMAFALAMRDTRTQASCVILSTTLVIVMATVILCGGLTTQVLQWLHIRVGVEEEMELQTFDSGHSFRQYNTIAESAARHSTSINIAVNDIQEQPEGGRLVGKALLVKAWYYLDAKFVKPLLTHARPPLTETLPKCCLPLSKLLTTTEQMTQGGSRDMTGRDEMDDYIINNMEQMPAQDTFNSLATSQDLTNPDDLDKTLLTRVRVPGPAGISL